MHYPLNRIRYQDASRITPRRFTPLEDLLIVDTSAFAAPHSHLLVDYMAKGGSVIIPSAVNAEIEVLGSQTIKRQGTGTNTTTGRLRIPINARILFDEAKARKRELVVPYSQDSDTRSQARLCEALAEILPKRHAYQLTFERHADWYKALGQTVAYHQNAGKSVELADIRNHESGAYRLLELLLRPTDGMPPELRTRLAQVQDDITRAQTKYVSTFLSLLGPEAQNLRVGEELLHERYAELLRESATSILLRLLGYHLDVNAPKSAAYALEGTAKRFAPRPNSKDADASCVVISYTLGIEPKKNRYIYSSDRDIMQLLELRKLCAEHRELRKNVYKTLHIERESQRLPRQ